MFEAAELGHTLSEATFKRRLPKLREELLDVQHELLATQRFPVLVLVSGVDGAGKGETVNALSEWMDARYLHAWAFDEPTREERERPAMTRYWAELPPKGRIGVFFGSWYTSPIVDRVHRRTGKLELERSLERIMKLERMLTDDGGLLVKLWFHLSKDRQKKRLHELEARDETRWRVTEADWKGFRRYDAYRSVSEKVLRETSTASAPWTVIDGSCERYRSFTAAKVLLDSLRARLAEKEPGRSRPVPPPVTPRDDRKDVLAAIDLSVSLPKKTYEKRLEKLQGTLNLLSRHPKIQKRGVVLLMEGADAAGKGGAIRRVTSALDARRYRVIPIAAPTEEERAQPYLWRFYRRLPRHGHFTVFDRSWYGRVLVERVEGFAAEADWRRAYSEIVEFEEQVVEAGTVLVKVWLQIDKAEQLRRFEERKATGFKRHKLTTEDVRNRRKWPAYHQAACDMIERTSTELSPWTLVAGNDKRHARIAVLEALVGALDEAAG